MMYVGISSSLVRRSAARPCWAKRQILESRLVGDAVELGRHDEVVFVQPFDLFCLQRDRCVAPAKADRGVVRFGFGECRRTLHERKRLPEIFETVGALYPLRVVEQIPVRRLSVKAGGLPLRQRRNAAAARHAAFFGECYWHRFSPWGAGYH